MLTDPIMLTIATGAARWFELAGIAVIITGTLVAFARTAVILIAGKSYSQEPQSALTPVFRRTLGRSILAGLELLVAADIIRTVAIEPTLRNAMVLGLIVLIRTFLSISLEVEIEGRWPWRSRS